VEVVGEVEAGGWGVPDGGRGRGGCPVSFEICYFMRNKRRRWLLSELVLCYGHVLIYNRGAYCAMVAISLLNLPLDLPRDSPAWSREGDTLLTGLPEWIGRCKLGIFT